VETAYEAPTLRAAWLAQAHTRPWTALGLVIAALAILWLVGLSLWRVVLGEADAALGLGMLGGLAGFAATALGAIPGIALRGVSARVEDSMLGLAAGMMLAASSFSLILPGLEAGQAITGSRAIGAFIVVAGMGLGVLLMVGLDSSPRMSMSTWDPAVPVASGSADCRCSCWPSPSITCPKVWRSVCPSPRATCTWVYP